MPTLNTLVHIEDKQHPGSTALFKQLKGCTLGKIEESPELWTCEIHDQGAHYGITTKKLQFPSHPRAKVRHQGQPGFARAQPSLQTIIFLRRDKQDKASASAEAESVNLCLAEYGWELRADQVAVRCGNKENILVEWMHPVNSPHRVDEELQAMTQTMHWWRFHQV